MLTLSEISIRLRDYFTLIGNEIVCDFCCNSYDIIINNEDVREHLKNTHEAYENAVSSNSTQEDLKKFYIIDNNNIKCKLCDKLYISSNTHSIIKYHLGEGHKTDEDKVKKFCEWIGEKYELNESDGKQYCNNCQKDILNRPSHLITHLELDHHDEDCLKYKPAYDRVENRLDHLFNNWIWNYFIRDGKYAHCSVCDKNDIKVYQHSLRRTFEIRHHMKETHNSKECVLSNDKSKKFSYSEIQDDLVKCNICNEIAESIFDINYRIEHHLEDKHGITTAHSTIFSNWVFEHIDKLQGFQKSQCKHCNDTSMLRKMSPYNLYEHLIEVHGIEMFSKYSLMCMNPQPGTSKSSGIEVRDVDCDRDNTMGNLKRKLSSLSSSDKNVIDVATSSTVPQAGSSKDLDTDGRDSGMKKVKYDDDTRPPDEFGAPSSLITPVDIVEVIAAPSIDQESTSSSCTILRELDTNPDDPDNDLNSIAMKITPIDN